MEWFAIGLIFNFVGIVVLARALANTDDETLAAQASSVPGLNLDALCALAEKRVDARFGWPIFAAGFVMQGYAMTGFPAHPLAMAAAVSILAVVVLWYAMMRGTIAYNDTTRIAAKYNAAQASAASAKAATSPAPALIHEHRDDDAPTAVILPMPVAQDMAS